MGGLKLAGPATTRTFDLATVAPRLAAAHRAERRRLGELAAARRRERELVLRLARLVAHRDLQLVRAGTTRDGRYIDRRAKKLEHARSALRAAERRLADLERAA